MKFLRTGGLLRKEPQNFGFCTRSTIHMSSGGGVSSTPLVHSSDISPPNHLPPLQVVLRETVRIQKHSSSSNTTSTFTCSSDSKDSGHESAKGMYFEISLIPVGNQAYASVSSFEIRQKRAFTQK
ncbi:UNVERIFIED_CONTAM: hypothetical protein K2H54_049926 [Gekko kuhli]